MPSPYMFRDPAAFYEATVATSPVLKRTPHVVHRLWLSLQPRPGPKTGRPVGEVMRVFEDVREPDHHESFSESARLLGADRRTVQRVITHIASGQAATVNLYWDTACASDPHHWHRPA